LAAHVVFVLGAAFLVRCLVAGGVGRVGQERELGPELGEDGLLQDGFIHGDQGE
jgi:hypothetical protein